MSTTNHSLRPVTQEPLPNPVEHEKSVYQNGLRYERPPFTFHATEWESQASQYLSANNKGYLVGNAGTGETAKKNTEAFKKWSLVPRRLVQTEKLPNLSTRILGHKSQFPVAATPVGALHRHLNPDGEVAVAQACDENNVPYILSTASSTSIEEAAEANGKGVRWFQPYWPKKEDEEVTVSMLDRAKKAGYTALVVTLDTYILGWRPSDMDNGYNPFLRSDQIGTAIGLSDPVYRRRFKETHGMEVEEDMGSAVAEWARTIFPGSSHGWEDVEFLQKHWGGPIILKGIQNVEDAKKCVEVGVEGMVVSNHGGRQVNGGVSSLAMLPKIVDAVGHKINIIFDSGIRRGADIAKAMALGAKMCLIGRPYVYSLALGGQAGVTHVFKSLLGELELNLHLSGLLSVSPRDLNRGVLVREWDLY